MEYNSILITGGAGFVGSYLAISFKQRNSNIRVIVLDNLKRRGSELNIKRLKEAGIEFIHGDIRNPEDLELETKVDLLIECSAEPTVLAGYGGSPAYIINTNLVGTINCLELARKNQADVVFLSTSRVYPYQAINELKTEEAETRFVWSEKQEVPGWSSKGVGAGFTLNGARSMYGSTKLCSEILLQEYISMYGIRGVINRCGVIGGPWQFGKVDQGIFTLWMLFHYFKKDLRYIGFGGKGKQVRDLLHVDDLFSLINKQLPILDKINNQVFNVGGGTFSNLSLLETTKLAEEITGNQIKIHPDLTSRPADIDIYITDNTKASELCNWHPAREKESTLADIFHWIRKYEKDLSGCLL